MTTALGTPVTRRERRTRKTAKRPPKVTFLGVLGELLFTAGLLVMLYLVWQLWWNDIVVRAEQDGNAAALSESWAGDLGNLPTGDDQTDFGAPPVSPEPVDGETFAVLKVPRFGQDFGAEIAGGVSKARTLDKIGICHYPDTQVLGENGNFALAGHRNTYGKPLNQIAELQVGDSIIVQTKDGWYTYKFRTLEYVTPKAVDVLNPVPQTEVTEMTDSFITLTSCNPKLSTAERIVAYGVFDSWRPTDAGPPAELAAQK